MTLLGRVAEPLLPDYTLTLSRRGDRLTIEAHRELTGSVSRYDLPLAAAPWLHQTITQGFWRTPEAGGLPREQHAVSTHVGGELLTLRRAWGLGGPGEPGFTLTIGEALDELGLPVELPMSDEILLRGGLLALLAAA